MSTHISLVPTRPIHSWHSVTDVFLRCVSQPCDCVVTTHYAPYNLLAFFSHSFISFCLSRCLPSFTAEHVLGAGAFPVAGVNSRQNRRLLPSWSLYASEGSYTVKNSEETLAIYGGLELWRKVSQGRERRYNFEGSVRVGLCVKVTFRQRPEGG